jgi:hypothetical protein
MGGLAHPLTLEATFCDPDGNAINSTYQGVALAGEKLPSSVKRVFLKTEVPCGAEFELVLKVEDSEVMRYRARLPVPLDMQEPLSRIFLRTGVPLAQLAGKTPGLKPEEFKQAAEDLGEFEADVWGRFTVQENGFVEYEIHVGQAGLNAVKFVIRNQFWMKLG